MLGEGEGTVKGTSCACDLALVHEELAVVQPDARHLSVCLLCVCGEVSVWGDEGRRLLQVSDNM